MKKRIRPETAAVRGSSDMEKKNAPVAPPIYQTSTFEVTDNEEQIRVTTTDRYYTRWGNPTARPSTAPVLAARRPSKGRTFRRPSSVGFSAGLTLKVRSRHRLPTIRKRGGAFPFQASYALTHA